MDKLKEKERLTCLQSSPPSDVGSPAQEGGVLLGQADRLDVVLVVGIVVQDQDGDVEAIRLRSESEVGMQPHLGHREHLVRQGLDVRVQDVVTQGHSDRRWVVLGSSDTVTSGHDVLGTDQGTAAPRPAHLYERLFFGMCVCVSFCFVCHNGSP